MGGTSFLAGGLPLLLGQTVLVIGLLDSKTEAFAASGIGQTIARLSIRFPNMPRSPFMSI
jgi:hypothetical protein